MSMRPSFGQTERMIAMWRRLRTEILAESRRQEDERWHKIFRGGKILGSVIGGTIPVGTIPSIIDAHARVSVRLNSGGTTYGPRRRLNIIAAGVTAADDAVNEEIDITLPAIAHNLFSSTHGDVDDTDTPVTGDLLTYNGTDWVAQAPAATLRVREVDSNPDVNPTDTIIVPNGSLTSLGSGDVQLTYGNMNDPITTEGDLIIGDNTVDPIRLAVGDEGQILLANATRPYWGEATDARRRWEPLANGDEASPELIFADGDVLMCEVPL